MQPVSDVIYLIFFTGSIFFNTTLFTSKIEALPTSFDTYNFSIKRRRIVEIIVLFAIFPAAYANWQLINSGVEMWRLNQEFWNTRSGGNYLVELYEQNIIQPLTYMLMTTCMFTLYYDQKKFSKYITLVVGIVLAFAHMILTGGGRTVLLTLSYIFFLSYLAGQAMKQNNIVFQVKIRYLIILFVLALFGISFASIGRGDSSAFVDVMLERFTLFPALFEGWYKLTDECEGFTLGLSMFETPIVLLTYPIRDLLTFERISTLEQVAQFAPALGDSSNAYVSAYLYYMRDFGFLGVALGPYIVGKIYNWIWKFCRKDSFMVFYYMTGICLTCLDSNYPFARGFMFILIFALLYRKFIRV